jgi:hypothetical protein
MATDEWRDLYPRRVVEVLANRSSDHTPLLICFNKCHGSHRPWRNCDLRRSGMGWKNQKL